MLATLVLPISDFVEDSGDNEVSYSINMSGYGTVRGISYTVPAHSSGEICADLYIPALTSQDIDNLNSLVMSLLTASQKEEVKTHEETAESGNLSIWSWFFGGAGASASYKQTRDTMKARGLTDAQITTVTNAFMEIATKMSDVKMDITVNNNNGDFPVSGDLYFYVLSGNISTGKETRAYQMIGNNGTAGSMPNAGGAPATATTVPLN